MSLPPPPAALSRTFNDASALDTPLPARRTAVVALVFREIDAGLHLCIGRRATVAGDPWSGDLAFPGGKPDPGDLTLHDTAARETFEEVGIPLPPAALIGDLGEVPANGGSRPLVTFPLVYMLNGAPPAFCLDHELVDAGWVALDALWDPANWGRFRFRGRDFSGIRAMDHYLWGYSLRVLHEFSCRIGHPLTRLYDGGDLPTFDGAAIAGTRIG